MENTEDACPFLVPVVADRLWVVRTTAYCRASDHVRVPALRTVADRCLNAYRSCPGYQAGIGRSQPRVNGARG